MTNHECLKIVKGTKKGESRCSFGAKPWQQTTICYLSAAQVGKRTYEAGHASNLYCKSSIRRK